MYSKSQPIAPMLILAGWALVYRDVCSWAYHFTHHSIDIPPYMARNYTSDESTNITHDEL